MWAYLWRLLITLFYHKIQYADAAWYTWDCFFIFFCYSLFSSLLPGVWTLSTLHWILMSLQLKHSFAGTILGNHWSLKNCFPCSLWSVWRCLENTSFLHDLCESECFDWFSQIDVDMAVSFSTGKKSRLTHLQQSVHQSTLLPYWFSLSYPTFIHDEDLQHNSYCGETLVQMNTASLVCSRDITAMVTDIQRHCKSYDATGSQNISGIEYTFKPSDLAAIPAAY